MTVFNPILRGGTFTFVVGPDKVSFVVHKKVIEDNSEVLGTMMNNGAMQESTTGVARLGDTEADTFALFAEFVYTGFYRMIGHPSNEHSVWFNVHCYVCPDQHVLPGSLGAVPVSCPSCGDAHIIVGDIDNQVIVRNIQTDKIRKNRKRKRASEYRYGDIFRRQNTLALNQSNEAIAFKGRSYPALGRSRLELKRYLTNLQPSDLVTQHVSAHARLYVFAQKYMVDSLKKLCLHKLHRDLIEFSVMPSSVVEIVELLTYTYDNTTDKEDEQEESTPTAASVKHATVRVTSVSSSDAGQDEDDIEDTEDNGGESSSESEHGVDGSVDGSVTERRATRSMLTDDQELRDLVMSYAVLNAQELMRHSSFRDMVQQGGQLVSDFTDGITKRLGT